MAIQFTYPRKNNPDSNDLLLIADSQNYWRTRQITIEDIAAAVIPGGYTLPTASTTVLGAVRIDGDTIDVDINGVISVSSSVGQQNLQQVTDIGNTTTNSIKINNNSLKVSNNLSIALPISGIGNSLIFGDSNTIANSLGYQEANLLIAGNTDESWAGNSMPNGGAVNLMMGNNNTLSTNSSTFSSYNIIQGYNNTVNNLSHSLVVGSENSTDSIAAVTNRGYLGCTMLGTHNTLKGSEATPGSHLIGYALTSNQAFTTVVGSFNTERTPEYTGSYGVAANFNNGLFARFVVGIGDIGGGPGGLIGAIRKDGFVVLKNGTVTANELTKTIIDAESTGRVLVTREWIEDNISRESPFLMTASPGGSQTYTGSENIIYLNWSGASGIYNITLPSAADIPYREIKIISDGTLNANDKVHVLAPVSESIDGQLNPLFYTLNKAYNGVTVWSDGSNWIVTQAKAT